MMKTTINRTPSRFDRSPLPPPHHPPAFVNNLYSFITSSPAKKIVIEITTISNEKWLSLPFLSRPLHRTIRLKTITENIL